MTGKRKAREFTTLYPVRIPTVSCPAWLRESLDKQAREQDKMLTQIVRDHLIKACIEDRPEDTS